MISVCLVDDQNLVRQGVRSLLDLAEDIRVVAECAEQPAWEDVIDAILSAIGTHHGVALAAIVLVAPGELPKTASGKVQRGRARQLYLDGAFVPLHAWVRPPARE